MELEDYRAALIEFREDGVHSYRLIEYAPDSNHLLKAVSESVNDSARTLVEAHWEYMIDLDFGVGYGQRPEDRSGHKEVIGYLTALSDELIADFQFDSDDKIRDTEWYAFVKEINDFLPDENHVRVPVEGDLIHFSGWMLEREIYSYPSFGQLSLSTSEAQFLGELSVLALRETFDEIIRRDREREYMQFFYRVIQRFNDHYV